MTSRIDPQTGALTPPDFFRCQAEVLEGEPFRIGAPFAMKRCKNVPIAVLVETTPSKRDGLKGSMSVCKVCYKQFRKQCPDAVVAVWKNSGMMKG